MNRKLNRLLVVRFKKALIVPMLLSFLLVQIPWAMGARISVWLDDGTKAPGSTSAGQACANLRDAIWDVPATAELGLSGIGAVVMTVRLVSFDGKGNSRESTTGGGNGLSVRTGSNNFWMDAGNHEGSAFQLKFYKDAAKTQGITGLDITFKQIMVRTADANLDVNAYAGFGRLAVSDKGTSDTDKVTLNGQDMTYAGDFAKSFAGETLVPILEKQLNHSTYSTRKSLDAAITPPDFFIIKGTDAITFDENDTFWLRRYNLNSVHDNGYQVAGLTFDIQKKAEGK